MKLITTFYREQINLIKYHPEVLSIKIARPILSARHMGSVSPIDQMRPEKVEISEPRAVCGGRYPQRANSLAAACVFRQNRNQCCGIVKPEHPGANLASSGLLARGQLTRSLTLSAVEGKKDKQQDRVASTLDPFPKGVKALRPQLYLFTAL